MVYLDILKYTPISCGLPAPEGKAGGGRSLGPTSASGSTVGGRQAPAAARGTRAGGPGARGRAGPASSLVRSGSPSLEHPRETLAMGGSGHSKDRPLACLRRTGPLHDGRIPSTCAAVRGGPPAAPRSRSAIPRIRAFARSTTDATTSSPSSGSSRSTAGSPYRNTTAWGSRRMSRSIANGRSGTASSARSPSSTRSCVRPNGTPSNTSVAMMAFPTARRAVKVEIILADRSD